MKSICNSINPPFLYHGKYALDPYELLRILDVIGRVDGRNQVFGIVVLTRLSNGQRNQGDSYQVDCLYYDQGQRSTMIWTSTGSMTKNLSDPVSGPHEHWRYFCLDRTQSTPQTLRKSAHLDMA